MSPKRVFAFRHIPFEGLGLIRAPLEVMWKPSGPGMAGGPYFWATWK